MNILAPKVDTRAYDGFFLDANLRAHAPEGVNPEELLAAGDPKDELALYVNGINTDLARQRCDMDRLKSLGYRVVGVHNATAGVARDLAQCVTDKWNTGRNGAVTTVKSMLRTALESGRSLTLIGHSQGALICSRALWELRGEMMKDGVNSDQVEEKLSQVKLHTAGGAAHSFPDGPSYHHRVNLMDPVALVAGLMMSMLPGVQAGAGAQVETFCRIAKPSGHECSGSAIKPSFLDTALHGVGVYYGG